MEKAMSNTEMTYCEYDFDSFRRYISDEVLREGRPGEIKKFFFGGKFTLCFAGKTVKNEANERGNGGFARFVGSFDDIDAIPRK